MAGYSCCRTAGSKPCIRLSISSPVLSVASASVSALIMIRQTLFATGDIKIFCRICLCPPSFSFQLWMRRHMRLLISKRCHVSYPHTAPISKSQGSSTYGGITETLGNVALWIRGGLNTFPASAIPSSTKRSGTLR